MKIDKKVKIGLVGAGYWGKNLLRNFVNCTKTSVVAVCDIDTEAAAAKTSQYGDIQIFSNIDSMLAHSDIEAVAIATPVSTHYNIAMAALRADKHVLVEKPISLNYKTAASLTKTAKERELIFMCDHTFCYSGPVKALKEIVQSNILGDILYINSIRTNLGLFQKDVNVLWDLAPHDLSIVEYVLGDSYVPARISCNTTTHPGSPYAADAHMTLTLESGVTINIHNSWLAPVKTRQMTIVGAKKMLVWDDLLPNEKIKIYNKRMTAEGDKFIYIDHGIMVPPIDLKEPLLEVAEDFANCILTGSEPIATGIKAAQVVQILELADKSAESRSNIEVTRDFR